MPDELAVRIGLRINKSRTNRAWTQPRLADEIWSLERLDDTTREGPKVNGCYISRWGHGQRPSPYYEDLLARALGISGEVLYKLPLDDEDKDDENAA